MWAEFFLAMFNRFGYPLGNTEGAQPQIEEIRHKMRMLSRLDDCDLEMDHAGNERSDNTILDCLGCAFRRKQKSSVKYPTVYQKYDSKTEKVAESAQNQEKKSQETAKKQPKVANSSYM